MQLLRLTTYVLVAILLASSAQSAEYYLRAHATTRTMPDGVVVPMWGFSLDTDENFATVDGAAQIPGPQLEVPVGDTTLTVHVQNDLIEPISLVIPGQAAPMAPTFVGGRMFSLTHEAAPGGSATYTWSNVRPGTFLYQTGSHQAAQVQMGLYGAMIHDVAAGEAYVGRDYDSSETLIFSEIDPAMHTAVANDDFGAGEPVTSAIGYAPRYFLINGEPFEAGDAPIGVGAEGANVLLRLLNAGYQTYVPVLQDLYMQIIADDGNELPYPRVQYSVELHAGKTHDALVNIPCDSGARSYTIQDRRGNVRNGSTSPGGMTVQLSVVDFDGDASTVCDNCAAVANSTQLDTDIDGFGNLCDADLDNSMLVNFGDFGMFVTAFVQQSNPDADFNGDGFINFGDLGVLAMGFGKPPGPSLSPTAAP